MISKSKLIFLAIFISFSIVDCAKLARKQKPNVVLADNAFCENLSSAFYVSDNTNVVGTNVSAIVRNVTEARCLELCANNHDAKGRLIFCASVAYETRSSTCHMYRKSSAPDGELVHRSESGKRFFEKFCLADDLPTDCAGKQFVRVDEYILKGYAQATAVVSTLAECVAHCVREKEFQCKSAMYFYEEGECITNVESAITQPDDFMKPDDDDKVIFFHNGCIQHIPTAAAESEDDASQMVSAGGAEIAASQDESPKQEMTAEHSGSKLEVSTNSVNDAPKSSPKPMDSTPIPSTTVTEKEMTRTAGDSKMIDSKPSKLNMKEKIHPVSTAKNDDDQSMPIAPPFSDARGDESDATASTLSKNIQTRLYGAKQLEKSADGTFSFQEKPDFSSSNANGTSEKPTVSANGKDGGPEHPPSGQIVVEDVINTGSSQSGNVPEAKDLKSKQEDSEKSKKRIAGPPGVAPPQSEFSLGVQQHAESDAEVEHRPNLSAILASTKSAPRAAMPKILVEQQKQQKMEQQKQQPVEQQKQQPGEQQKQQPVEPQKQQQSEQEKQQQMDKNKQQSMDKEKKEQQNVKDEIPNKSQQINAGTQADRENVATANNEHTKMEQTQHKEMKDDDGMTSSEVGKAEPNANKAQNQKVEKEGKIDEFKQAAKETNGKEQEVTEQKNDSNTMKDAESMDAGVHGIHSVAIAPVEDKNIEEPKVEPTKRLQLKSIKGLTNDELEFFSAWGDWTPCRAAGERRIRRRKCLDLRRCRGALMQIDYCPRDLPSASESDDDSSSPIDGPTPPPRSIASASSIADAPQPQNNVDGPAGPLRSPLPINVANVAGSAGAPPSILPQKLPEKVLKPLPEGAPGRPDDVWSPWLGTCQQFASAQPCKNNQMIGFESRECIAKDPKSCKGPFFRYCTLPC